MHDVERDSRQRDPVLRTLSEQKDGLGALAPRPVISTAPSNVSYGADLQVTTPMPPRSATWRWYGSGP